MTRPAALAAHVLAPVCTSQRGMTLAVTRPALLAARKRCVCDTHPCPGHKFPGTSSANKPRQVVSSLTIRTWPACASPRLAQVHRCGRLLPAQWTKVSKIGGHKPSQIVMI